MDDKLHMTNAALEGQALLVSEVAGARFGISVLRFVSQAAKIENFGAFYFADLLHPKPVLSVSAGRMSDYIFRRDADQILSDAEMRNEIAVQIQNAPRHGVLIERWHPSGDDPRKALYDRSKILERVAVSSRLGRGGIRSFFLRSNSAGWMNDAEYFALCELLPFVHELIGLRHRIVGAEQFQYSAQRNASSLRERNAPGFSLLSQREAQCCDCLIAGKSVAGTALELKVAETTVRTMRQRAYRKLGVSSAAQIMALLINEKV